MVKNPFAKQETQVRSLEEEMATCSSILAWRIPCTEEPGGLQSRDCKELDMTERRTPCCGRAVSRVLGLSSLDAQAPKHRVSSGGPRAQLPHSTWDLP